MTKEKGGEEKYGGGRESDGGGRKNERELEIQGFQKWEKRQQTRLTVDHPLDRGLTESISVTVGQPAQTKNNFYISSCLGQSLGRPDLYQDNSIDRSVDRDCPKNNFKKI